jgi:hypothetical protein
MNADSLICSIMIVPWHYHTRQETGPPTFPFLHYSRLVSSDKAGSGKGDGCQGENPQDELLTKTGIVWPAENFDGNEKT